MPHHLAVLPRKRGDSNAHRLSTRTVLRTRLLIQPARFPDNGLSVDGRGRTCTLRFRRPASSPFDHVDMSATEGTRTPDLSLDGRVLPLTELRRHGAWVGRESNPLCRSTASQKRRYSRTAAPHGATDPWSSEPVVAPAPTNDVSDAVVKVMLAELDARRAGRPGRSRTLGRWFWRPQRRPGSSLCKRRNGIGHA
jgi:hypothetical protein